MGDHLGLPREDAVRTQSRASDLEVTQVAGGQTWERGFNPWDGKIPWRRAWQPTPVFLPGESPGTEEPGGLQPVGSQSVGHNAGAQHNTTRGFPHCSGREPEAPGFKTVRHCSNVMTETTNQNSILQRLQFAS